MRSKKLVLFLSVLILSISMVSTTLFAAEKEVDWLGEADKSGRLEAAVASVIREGKVRTYDMGGSHTTMEMAAEIAHKLTLTTGAKAQA